MRKPDWLDLYLGPAAVAFQLGVGIACLAIGGIILGLKINRLADSLSPVPRFALHFARFAYSLVLAAVVALAWVYELISVRVSIAEFAFMVAGAALATIVLIRAGVFRKE